MNWMSKVLRRLPEFGGQERRTSLENPQTPLSFPAEWLLDIFNGGRTDSGIRVSEMTALQVGPVYACVNLISDGVSSLPLNVYEKSMQGKRVRKTLAVDNALYDFLTVEPNPEMTAPVFFKVLVVHALLWGNAYAEIERDEANRILNIWPRNPARTRPIRLIKSITLQGDLLPAGTLLFETSDNMQDNSSVNSDSNATPKDMGQRRLVLMEDMIHVPGLSLDGRLGQSTVWLARQAFGLSLATEKYAAKFFGNGARPAGILTLPNKMDDEAVENLRKSWAEAHGGENQFKVAVLEQGVKYEKIASTPEEGQMLETRKYERQEVCGIFGVPQHMIMSDVPGKSNVEQSSIEFVLYCLHPWLLRFEKEIERKLFPSMGRTAGRFFPKFDVRKLMYPDATARGQFYMLGKQWGFLNTNDILELEDMNPCENDEVGERYWQPINMQDASKALAPSELADQKAEQQKDLATHQNGLQQETDAAAAKLQMKTAAQTHDHTMAQGQQNNKHAQAMAKLGHPLQQAPGGGAPATGVPKVRTYNNPVEMRAAMEELLEQSFFFISSETDGTAMVYRYMHPDRREVSLRYSEDQPRDDHGRFASGGGGDSKDGGSGDGSTPGPRGGSTDFKLPDGRTMSFSNNQEERLAQVREFGNQEMAKLPENVQQALLRGAEEGNSNVTADLNKGPDGQYTAERMVWQDAAIGQKLAEATPVENPTVVYVAGGPASGKTGAADEVAKELQNFVGINVDGLRVQAPEFTACLPDRLMGLNSELGDVRDRLMFAAAAERKNMLIDGVGSKDAAANVQKLQEMGYNVKYVYVHTPVETAVERADTRPFSTKNLADLRILPKGAVEKFHDKARSANPEWRAFANEVKVIDKSNRDFGHAGKVVYYQKNGVVHTYDEEGVNRVGNGGKTKIDIPRG